MFLISETDEFPDVELAAVAPNGLLAVGGSLTPERILNAYTRGIFPWYSADDPILWWSPDPRAVLFSQHLKCSRSLRKTLKQQRFEISIDQRFGAVIRACSEPRQGDARTWINPQIIYAYEQLHALGYAHSVEAWHAGQLVGGLYGVAIGKVFFGESMFALHNNASKCAFVYLAKHLAHWQYPLIDCQVQTAHLDSLGAVLIPRIQFVEYLQQYCFISTRPATWQICLSLEQVLN